MDRITWWDIIGVIVIVMSSIFFFEFVMKQLGENLLNVLLAGFLSTIFGTVLWYIQISLQRKFQR